jgi:hypothetical protein
VGSVITLLWPKGIRNHFVVRWFDESYYQTQMCLCGVDTFFWCSCCPTPSSTAGFFKHIFLSLSCYDVGIFSCKGWLAGNRKSRQREFRLTSEIGRFYLSTTLNFSCWLAKEKKPIFCIFFRRR